MPGVPTSRGCEACRKQKKKCDQVKPICGRCTRLDIECVGSGQRRYKFQDPNVLVTAGESSDTKTLTIRQVPSSETGYTANALVHALQTKDLRYDLDVYGPFLQFVPRHLGYNAALDSAAWTFVCSIRSMQTTNKFHQIQGSENEAEALAAYGKTMTAIRTVLDKPGQAYSAEVLCAVHILTICSYWIDHPSDPYANHSFIQSHLLTGLIARGWKSNFERIMMVTASVPIIVTAMRNMAVMEPVESWLNLLANTYGPDRPWKANDGRLLRSIAMNKLIRLPHYSHEPEKHLPEIEEMLEISMHDQAEVRKQVELLKADVPVLLDGRTSVPVKRLAVHQNIYSLSLCVSIFLNATVRCFDMPAQREIDLLNENAMLIESVLWLCEEMLPLRPFWPQALPILLAAALATSNNRSTERHLERMLRLHAREHNVEGYMAGSRWLRRKFELQKARLSMTTDLESLKREMPLEHLEEDVYIATKSRCTIL